MKHVLVARPRFRIQVIAAGARGAAGSGGAEADQLRALVDELMARVEALEAGTPSTPANALTDSSGNALTDQSGQILTMGAVAA